jgi:hypothetical protein
MTFRPDGSSLRHLEGRDFVYRDAPLSLSLSLSGFRREGEVFHSSEFWEGSLAIKMSNPTRNCGSRGIRRRSSRLLLA